MRAVKGTALVLMLASGISRAEPPPAQGSVDYVAAARECTRYAERAQAEQKELLRLLARISENSKVETNRQKLVAAWGRYRQANDRIDECMKKSFDELPRL